MEPNVYYMPELSSDVWAFQRLDEVVCSLNLWNAILME